MNWTIEDANRELRRLTPGWVHEPWDAGTGIEASPNSISALAVHSHGGTEARVPRTREELLKRIESVQPWSPDVALQVCRAMLVGWIEEDDLFVPPDRETANWVRPDTWVSLEMDGSSRLTLIEACEKALALYAERHGKVKVESKEEWPGHDHLRGCSCCCGLRYFGVLCFDCYGVWMARGNAQGFDDWCRERWHALRAKGGDATVPDKRDRTSIDGSSESTGQVEGGGTVHPVTAPKLMPCAECRAPLLPHQVECLNNGKAWCSYCAMRQGLAKHDRVPDLPNYHHQPLDARIAAAQPNQELGNAWMSPTWEEG